MIVAGFHPGHIAAHFARIERETVFECSLEYAEQRLRRVIEDIADAAAVTETAQQFRLSALKIDIETIIAKLRAEAERTS